MRPIAEFPVSSEWIAMTLAEGRSFADFSKDQARTHEVKIDRQIEYLVRGIALEELTTKWMLTAFFNRREGFYRRSSCGQYYNRH